MLWYDATLIEEYARWKLGSLSGNAAPTLRSHGLRGTSGLDICNFATHPTAFYGYYRHRLLWAHLWLQG